MTNAPASGGRRCHVDREVLRHGDLRPVVAQLVGDGGVQRGAGDASQGAAAKVIDESVEGGHRPQTNLATLGVEETLVGRVEGDGAE
ncbi:MAG: hypothetical protein R3E79_45750 [Caldilineaceae bacterium]